MKLLVLGGGGFPGYHVVAEALASGHEVSTFTLLAASRGEVGARRPRTGHAPGSHPSRPGIRRRRQSTSGIRNPGPAEGEVLIAAGDEPVKVRELAEATDRIAGGPGQAKAWLLEQAREEFGIYADSLAESRRLSGQKARHLFGWEPASPPALEELERGSYGS